MSFNLLNDLSHVATVIGKVKKMSKAISTFGYSSSKANVVAAFKSGKREND